MRDLVLFEELRVAEPTVTPRRVSSSVRFVPRRGRAFTLPLSFVYDRPVVDPAAHRNWARLLVSVPALNYALFARRLVGEFALGPRDVAWLQESANATAREQLLNRFVGGHPLIRPAFAIAPERFSRALVRTARVVAERDRSRPVAQSAGLGHAVLSSGGKESLLTFGALREAGLDPLALFFNESGRHWHTALTSHRALGRSARRVWGDVDRFYAAANRRMPFVRRGFERLRSDSYPIQLFTFHVYQLASMPVLWAEGVGHLWMGNEFDEGPWPSLAGVRHWNGVYDQSQTFDRRASAFYAAKGWNVRQASLVRSMSGPLVQATLAARYPDLFATQTSCHATTIRRGAVRPCGSCSKCVGVLLFLLASGADPRRVRYRAGDVAALAERVASTTLRLDRGEAEDCLARLVARGWRFEGSANGFRPTERPEVRMLRFDATMSRPDNLPPALADRLYPLLLRDAQGAVARRGRSWRRLRGRFWDQRSFAYR